jgi:hypothetical protein
MTQSQLERAVARATGESVSQIRHLGFSLVVVPAPKQQRRGAIRLPFRKALARSRRYVRSHPPRTLAASAA